MMFTDNGFTVFPSPFGDILSTVMCFQSGKSHAILACKLPSLSWSPLLYLIMMLSPVTKKPEYLCLFKAVIFSVLHHFPSLLLPWNVLLANSEVSQNKSEWI